MGSPKADKLKSETSLCALRPRCSAVPGGMGLPTMVPLSSPPMWHAGMGLGFPAGLEAFREGTCNKNKQAVPRQSAKNVLTCPAVLLWVGCEASGAGSVGVVRTSRDGAGDAGKKQM